MLCSKCYKKIPAGEEIQKASTVHWRASWGSGGYGSEIVCKQCAKKINRLNDKFFTIFIGLFLFIFLASLLVWFCKIRENN